MKNKAKLKAGALLYAIFISFILCILTWTIILISQYSRMLSQQIVKESDLKDDLKSALNICMVHPDYFLKDSITIELYGNRNIQAKFKPWGMYSIVSLNTPTGNLKTTETFLVGDKIDKSDSTALYYTDSDHQLKVCGNTILKGDVYTPNGTIDRGYIEGKGFSGTSLVEGQVKMADLVLPQFDELKMKQIDLLFLGLASDENRHDAWQYIKEHNHTVTNSFNEKTLVLYSNGTLTIDETTLIGNVVIVAKDEIIVDSSVYLSDVILCAKDITLKTGFKGNIQAFATRSIAIGPGCKLAYPTVLMSIAKSDSSQVIVGKESTIAGDLILYGNEEHKKTKIILSGQSLLYGTLYTNIAVELDGWVLGSVYCNKIQLSTTSAEYTGYLFDGQIDVSKRPKMYGQSMIFSNQVKTEIKNLE
jgi:hypothetical protein